MPSNSRSLNKPNCFCSPRIAASTCPSNLLLRLATGGSGLLKSVRPICAVFP